MAMLILAGLAAVLLTVFVAGFLAGHAAGRAFGLSEAFDDSVMQEAAYLEALRRIR